MYSTRFIIECDGRNLPGRAFCTNKIESFSKSTAKARAKGLGWKTVRRFLDITQHFCPECRAAARGETTVDEHADSAIKAVS